MASQIVIATLVGVLAVLAAAGVLSGRLARRARGRGGFKQAPAGLRIATGIAFAAGVVAAVLTKRADRADRAAEGVIDAAEGAIDAADTVAVAATGSDGGTHLAIIVAIAVLLLVLAAIVLVRQRDQQR